MLMDPNTTVAEHYKKLKRVSLPHRLGEIESKIKEALYAYNYYQVVGPLAEAVDMMTQLLEELNENKG